MENVRFALAVLMLLGASISDLQIRRVRDRYWAPFIVAAGLLLAHDALNDNVAWLAIAVAAGTCALMYGLWWMGLFGGADAKGLMVMAWLWPAEPDILGGTTTPALDTLFNASLLVITVPIVFLLWNIVKRDLRWPLFLLGVRMSRDRARAGQMWPMETADGTLRLFHKPGEAVHWHGLPDRVWVTPKIPFMIPMLLGLIIAKWGNLLLRLSSI